MNLSIKHKNTGKVILEVNAESLSEANLREVEVVIQWQAQVEKRICYSVKHQNYVIHKLGCFWGCIKEGYSIPVKRHGHEDDCHLQECGVRIAMCSADPV